MVVYEVIDYPCTSFQHHGNKQVFITMVTNKNLLHEANFRGKQIVIVKLLPETVQEKGAIPPL